MDLALNNLQRLICHKTKQTKPNLFSCFEHNNLMWYRDPYLSGPFHNCIENLVMLVFITHLSPLDLCTYLMFVDV